MHAKRGSLDDPLLPSAPQPPPSSTASLILHLPFCHQHCLMVIMSTATGKKHDEGLNPLSKLKVRERERVPLISYDWLSKCALKCHLSDEKAKKKEEEECVPVLPLLMMVSLAVVLTSARAFGDVSEWAFAQQNAQLMLQLQVMLPLLYSSMRMLASTVAAPQYRNVRQPKWHLSSIPTVRLERELFRKMWCTWKCTEDCNQKVEGSTSGRVKLV